MSNKIIHQLLMTDSPMDSLHPCLGRKFPSRSGRSLLMVQAQVGLRRQYLLRLQFNRHNRSGVLKQTVRLLPLNVSVELQQVSSSTVQMVGTGRLPKQPHFHRRECSHSTPVVSCVGLYLLKNFLRISQKFPHCDRYLKRRQLPLQNIDMKDYTNGDRVPTTHEL